MWSGPVVQAGLPIQSTWSSSPPVVWAVSRKIVRNPVAGFTSSSPALTISPPVKARLRAVFSQRRAGAQQGAVDGRNARLQQPGRILGRPAEHVAQDQDCALPRRQAASSDQERQLDGLVRDDGRLGRCVRCGDRVEDTVGVRRVRMPSPALLALTGGQRRVGRDRIEPGAKRGAPAKALALVPDAQERLLRQVSEYSFAEDPVRMCLDLSPVPGRRAGRTRSRRLPWPRRRSGRLLWSTCGRRYGRPAGGRLGELTESASLNLSGVRCGGRIGQRTR